MFSIPTPTKLLVLVVVLAVVWFGFRMLGQIERQRRAQRGETGLAGWVRKAAGRASGRAAGRANHIDDTEKCARCGVYVAPSVAKSCGRPDCPYG